MQLLVPSALIFGLLAVPVIILYLLKLRRKEVAVSSTLLWQMLLRDRQANAPWQRLKRNLLLFLQLLILAGLVLALARPAILVPSLAAGSVVVLLDGSASMNARDGAAQTGDTPQATTRFEAAQAAALRLVEALPAGAQMTVILARQQPETLATQETGQARLRQAIAQAQPGQGPAGWEAALALAAGAAQASAARTPPTIVLISDGGLPAQGLLPLPGEVRYLPIGQTGENLAVSALALRAARQPGQAELFASLTNYGQAPRQAVAAFYAGGALFHSRQVDLPAGQTQSIVLTVQPEGETVYTARLSLPAGAGGPLDALPLDDAAFAVFQPLHTARVLLVSPGNLFLEQLLAALPGIRPFRALPAADGSFQLPEEPFDLYVLDGLLPTGLPANLLLVNPPPNDLVNVTGVFSNTQGIRAADHPLVEFTDWSNVHVRQARRVEPPAWAEVLVESDGGPLLLAGADAGRRVAVLTFDLHDSDLPLQITFPVLFANLVPYLVHAQPAQALSQAGDAGQLLQPGDPLQIPPPAGSTVLEITTPSGQVHRLAAGEDGALFTRTDAPGIYSIAAPGASLPPSPVAVNLFSPAESDIQPAGAIQLGSSSIPAVTEAEAGQRELWPWLAGLALVVLLLEWWVYHRQTGLAAQPP